MNSKKKTVNIIIIAIFIIFLVELLGGWLLLNFKAWVAVKRIELVEKYEVKSFAQETDFGEGVVVNQYIHGGDGTAENEKQYKMSKNIDEERK